MKDTVREKLPIVFDLGGREIRGALRFLRNLGVTSDRLLPYGLQLVLLGEFFRLCQRPADKVVELLNRWFWVTSFTGWFGGVNTAQATHALGEIRDLARGTGTGFSSVDLDAQAQPFPKRFDGRSARVRAFLLYLASLRPLSLSSEKASIPVNCSPLVEPWQWATCHPTRATWGAFQQPGKPHVHRRRAGRPSVRQPD